MYTCVGWWMYIDVCLMADAYVCVSLMVDVCIYRFDSGCIYIHVSDDGCTCVVMVDAYVYVFDCAGTCVR